MNRPAFTAGLLATALLAEVLGAPSLRGEIVYNGADLSENFDSLGTTVISNNWSGTPDVQAAAPGTTGFDGTKLAGASAGASLAVSDGSSNAGAIHSFGSASVNPTDRALGSIASSMNTMAFGFSLVNNVAGTAISSITVSFNQENWRTPTSVSNTLSAAWGTSATAGVTTSNYLTAAGMTAESALNMTLAFTTTNMALDGNSNRVAKSFTFSSLNLLQNDRFFLRWQDVDNTGNDAGIGMDDMTLSFVVSVVPEAPAAALGALACGAAGLAWAGRELRRRRCAKGAKE